MIHYITDIQHDQELDLIAPFASEDLIVKSDGVEIANISPAGNWSHSKLVSINYPVAVHSAFELGHVLDAYLGTQWVGSTEI